MSCRRIKRKKGRKEQAAGRTQNREKRRNERLRKLWFAKRGLAWMLTAAMAAGMTVPAQADENRKEVSALMLNREEAGGGEVFLTASPSDAADEQMKQKLLQRSSGSMKRLITSKTLIQP